MKKTALFIILFLPNLLPAMAGDGPVTAAGFPAEGKLEPFLGEPRLEMQRVFGDQRLPNVVVATDGTVLAMWGWGRVRVRRSEDGGKSWGPEIHLGDGLNAGGFTVDEKTGHVLAFVEEKHPPAPLTVYRSKDNGKTWNAQKTVILKDSKGNVPSMCMNEHGITLRHGKHKGRLLRPSRWYAGKSERARWAQHYTNAIYSDDGGKTWQASDPFPAMGTGEATVAELSDGRIYYNSRRHWAPKGKNARRRWTASSEDGGATWKDLSICEVLPDGDQCRNYGLMGGLVRLPVQGRDILIFSNIESPKSRHHGTVWASFDGGKTWPIKRLVYEGKFAYSSLTAGRHGTASKGWIYLLFEGGPKGGATVARFNLGWLLGGEKTGDGTLPGWIHRKSESKGQASRPNVLFIAVDDWNDWVGCLGHERAITPNLDRLAAGGMLFTNAHCAAPVCNPSRTAVMLGRLPSSTGIYNNGQWWRAAHPDAVTLPAYFRSHGYHVAGAGKLFHHTPGFNDPRAYDTYYFWNPGVAEANGWGEVYHHPHWPGVKHKPASPVARKTTSNFDYAAIDLPEERLPDTRVALWAAGQLARKHDRPFFLAVGMFRPHLEWYAPRKYFDMYPLSEIRLPRVKDDDLDDLPPIARKWAADRGSTSTWIRKSGEWPKLVQAYLACISYSDAQVGRILDALEAGPNADNTVVVLWSDHGYHLGEKQHWHKSVLWERSTRVPLIVRVPGMTRPGSRCGRPVSLVDLYPTLVDLCGLPNKPGLDGRSIVPLLKDPAEKWPYTAVCIREPGNCAVRSERWRYIRYSDGSEELYDHSSDPDEWTNLAGRAKYKAVIADHARWIPKEFAPGAPSKGAYRFDPKAFTWTHKKTGKKTYGGKK